MGHAADNATLSFGFLRRSTTYIHVGVFRPTELGEDIEEYFQREVIPHLPDAWIDTKKADEKDGDVGIVGYEIPSNRHFYQHMPPRSLEEMDADLDKVSAEIMALLREVNGLLYSPYNMAESMSYNKVSL